MLFHFCKLGSSFAVSYWSYCLCHWSHSKIWRGKKNAVSILNVNLLLFSGVELFSSGCVQCVPTWSLKKTVAFRLVLMGYEKHGDNLSPVCSRFPSKFCRQSLTRWRQMMFGSWQNPLMKTVARVVSFGYSPHQVPKSTCATLNNHGTTTCSWTSGSHDTTAWSREVGLRKHCACMGSTSVVDGVAVGMQFICLHQYSWTTVAYVSPPPALTVLTVTVIPCSAWNLCKKKEEFELA